MRVNVYNEEITGEFEVVWVTAKETGKRFMGLRMFLKSPADLHHTADDDDRSAVTLWFGYRNKALEFLENAAQHVRTQG